MRSVLFAVVLTFTAGAAAMTGGAAEPPNAEPQQISGTVRNPLGDPLAGVRLRLRAADGRVLGHATTSAAGAFSFTGVAPGMYSILAEKSPYPTARTPVAVGNGPVAPVLLTMESAEAPVVEIIRVIAKRLDSARNALSPETGSSSYRFTQQDIAQLPQGENTPLNEIILQTPGAAQDSFGQLHIRGDHGNIQYRVNGIQLPEGISGFGQAISPRLASNISLITGALPAQYGYRTAGVIDIQAKSGTAGTNASLEMYGGQRRTLQPSFELGSAHGAFSYYLNGTYIGTDRGISPPTAAPTARHDHSDQGLGFGYFSYVLNPSLRLSLISGVDVNSFQIPAGPGKQPRFTLAGVTDFPSTQVAESQFEQTLYNVLALQGSLGSHVDYQVAAFSRYSTIDFSPDPSGDLIFNGIASQVFRGSFANGMQGDGAYRIGESHTLRAGFYFSAERAETDHHAAVFPADFSGNQTSPVPVNIVDDTAVTAWLYGVYLQDEWHPAAPLTINFGLRYDLTDAFVHADQFSPRIGAAYELPTQTTLHAGYSRYFTPPPAELVSAGAVHKFDRTTGALPSGGNFAVRPERSHYFDAGLSQRIGSGFTVGVDGYFKYADHILDEGQFGNALVFSPFNYRRGRVYGTEVSASYSRGDLSAYLNFAYAVAQGTQVETGQFNFNPEELAYINHRFIFLDHDQTFTSSGGASYTWHGYGLKFDYLYGSGLRNGFVNTGNLPFYIQANAGISHRFTVPRLGWLEARIDCLNLFDRTYLIRDGSGIGVQAAQYGPRRTVFAGIRIPLSFSQPAPAGS